MKQPRPNFLLLTSLLWISTHFFTAVAQHEAPAATDVTLTTQAEVDAFNCTSLSNLTINVQNGGSDPITNLDNLCSLLSVGQNLSIEDDGATLLNSLQGLHNLKSIGGNFNYSAHLANMQGMGKLEQIGGSLMVNEAGINNFAGLENLKTIGDQLSISRTPLENFIGLNHLSNVGGALILFSVDEISFQGLSSLKTVAGISFRSSAFADNFNGLSSLKLIDGELNLGGTDGGARSVIGLEKVEEIGGNLILTDKFNFAGFQGLNNLKRVGGNIALENNNIENFIGLENLEEVGGDFTSVLNKVSSVEGLQSLTSVGSLTFDEPLASLQGLEQLRQVNGVLSIIASNINSLEPLQNIENIARNLVLEYNDQLSDCCAILVIQDKVQGDIILNNNAAVCNSLEVIEESCEDEGSVVDCQQDVVLTTQAEVDAFDCTSVVNLTIDASVNTIDPVDPITNLLALSTLENVEQNLNIIGSGQSVLTSLEGLHNLKSIGGNFNYSANLPNLQGMGSLEEIGGNFDVYQAGILNNFVGLENLKTIEGRFSVIETSIENFTGLNSLTFVGGELRLDNINAVDQLSFEGLSALETVGGIIFLSTYVSAENFTGLENLKRIDGDLSVAGTDVFLGSLEGLESLEEITGNLRLSYKLSIIDFQGLNNLKRVGGNVSLETNGFESFDGLEQLEEVGGVLLVNNNGLTDISGLQSLTSVGGFYFDEPLASLEGLEQLRVVNGNFTLISTKINALDPIQNIETIAGDLSLQFNEQLSDCCLITSLLERVQGEVIVQDNAPGCNSLEDISTSCDDSPVNCGTNVFLTTQAEVNAFACEGLQNLTINLDTQTTDPITDLTPLRIIEQIQGDLTILLQGTALPSEGLENISTIGGGLFIQNGQINNFNILNRLTNIVGQFSFTETSINSFEGLTQLTEIGSFSLIDGEMSNFTGLSGLQVINGGLTLINIADFQNFQGLENLISSGGFNIQQILNINFNGLSSIETIGGLIINNISSLSFEGLESLQTIGGPTNIRNSNFNDFSGLNNLEEITGRLGVFFNTLQSFEGLNKLSNIGESLLVRDNPELTTLSGLENVSFISSLISINRNSNLSSCCIIPSLIAAVQTGDYNISENAPNCSSLEVIEENCDDEGGEENARTVTEIKAYPNPVMNAMQIMSEKAVSIKLYNNNGHLMKEQQIEKKGTLNMIALPAGVYLLEANGKIVNRIIKR